MKILAILFLCSIVLPAIGQEKIESEKRIASNQMPAGTLNVLGDFVSKVKKLRYYLETDGEKVSYEAKFRYKKKQASVEFDHDGKLEDIEILEKYSDLPESFRKAIERFLSDDFNAFHIVKCQEQYRHKTGSPDKTLRQALEGQWKGPVFYELEVDVKKEKNWHSEELLFDEKGGFLSRRRIIRRAQDNILY